LKNVPPKANNNNKNNKMSSDMKSVPDPGMSQDFSPHIEPISVQDFYMASIGQMTGQITST